MIKVLELFSGYGGCNFALTKAGVEHKTIGYSDIEKCALDIYSLNHGENIHSLGDITKIDENKLEDFDLLTGGFPCSPRGSLVKTDRGYTEIQNITCEDRVLTHNNQFKQVKTTMTKKSTHINTIKGVGCYDLKLTDNHPLYILRGSTFEWVPVSKIDNSDYITYNINNNKLNINNLSNVQLWLMGRYIADGSIDSRNRLYFSIGSHKFELFKSKVESYEYFTCHKDRNCQEVFVKDDILLKYCKMIGIGSKNKSIPNFIINLPKEDLKHFFDGYMSGDGHYDKTRDRFMYTTVSEKIALGMQEVVIKLFNKVPSISVRIDNRKESFNDTFNSQVCGKQRGVKVLNDKICVKIKSITREEKLIDVFNIEVDDDNSYTLNNIIVHNCQSFSTAGKRGGFAAANKGKLFFDIIRIAEAKNPRWMLLENVQGLLSHDDGKTMEIILSELHRIGYIVKWKLLFSKNHGTPQNRPRVWFACFREQEDADKFMFPEKEKLKLTVKDLLEDEVDEKYYLSEKQLEKINLHITNSKEKGGGFGNFPLDVEGHSTTLTSHMKKDINDVPYFKIADFRYDEGIRVRKDNVSLTINTREPPLVFNTAHTKANGKRWKDDGCAFTLEATQSQSQVINTITTGYGRQGSSKEFIAISKQVHNELNKWRRLTPRECFRLMGFFMDEIKFGNISDSKLYFLAGNGWDINTASKIFKQMFIGNSNEQKSMENFK